jgi:hypothetical protein
MIHLPSSSTGSSQICASFLPFDPDIVALYEFALLKDEKARRIGKEFSRGPF